MRPLVWWVQDHLGLAAAGLLGIVAIAVAIVIVISGGSADAPPRPSKVAATEPARTTKGPGDESTASPAAQPTQRRRAHAAAAHHRRQARHQNDAPAQGAHGGDSSTTKSKTRAADAATTRQPATRQPGEATRHSLGQATAEKVAAAHPGVSCPKSYSTRQCEEAVQAAADPAPSIPVTRPSDCTQAMSEAQCEELFAAEAAARAAGSGSTLPQECIEHPEQEKCAAVVEEMKAQYEAAHPGG